MEATSKPSGKVSITINNYKFEIVKEFKYLSTIVTSDNNISAEINSRILMANKCYYGLKNQLQSHYLSRDTKCKLYNTLIRPVITYGSESWTLNKGNTDKLRIFERKILRKIYGAVNEGGTCRIRYNVELYHLYKDPDVIKIVKANIIRWLGHIFRTDDSNPCKKVTFNNPLYGERRVGRPTTRWLDDVENDLENQCKPMKN
jgi:hypothetical protein